MTQELNIPDPFNITSYFIDRNLEEGRGGNTAIREAGRQWSYNDLARLVNRTGNGFRELHLDAEDRIVIAAPDSAEFIAAFFGAAKIGAIPIPVNTFAKPEDFVYFLNDSRARAFVIQDDLWPSVAPLLADVPDLEHVLVLPSVPAETQEVAAEPMAQAHYNFHRLTDVINSGSENLEAEQTSKDDLAFFLYTSGSTGGPKGAVHLQHDMFVSTVLYARGILEIQESDICFSASKLFFAYGLGNGSYFPFSVGASAVYNPHRPKPEIILDHVGQFRPTLFFSVPTLYAALLHAEAGADFSSVRFAVSAGEALPGEIFHRFKDEFGVSILDGIGSTEMLHIFISNRKDDIHPGSSGKLVPGYEARIVDDNGDSLPHSEIGNLWVKGDSAAAFYWRKHDKSKQTMLGEWLVTGDKYMIDENGYFHYAGRTDDMMRCSGQWVSPVEVENALIVHPAVLEAAVVGREDSDELIKPKAYIVLKNSSSPPTEDELRNFLRKKLAGYKVPRWFEYVEDLPKTATGKIQRYRLRS